MMFQNHGLRIAYDDWGSGLPILFVHGHPFDRTMWWPQMRSLRYRYRVIAPDLPGYGDSESNSNPNHTQEDFARDLIALLDHLGVERAVVVGLSMGGQIAMEFARSFPERAAALFLAATFPQPETEQGVEARNATADRILAEGIVPIGSEMLCKLMSAQSLRTKPEMAAKVFNMICRATARGAAAAVRGRARRFDYRLSLPGFMGPCKIIVGTADSFTTVEDAHLTQSMMKRCELEVYEEIGHLSNLEDEDRFNRSLHDFLEALE